MRIRRPAAHNPMIYRKVAKPAGHTCAACGCHVRPGLACDGCAFAAAVADLELDDRVAAELATYHSGSDPGDTGIDLNDPADRRARAHR